jgi:zinc transport system permease protein
MDVNELFELINTPFVQRALVGGILLGILGGLIGSFVILRRLALFGNSIGHSLLLGAVLAAMLGASPTWFLMVFAVVYGLIIIYFSDRTNLGSDTIFNIGISASVALGTIGFTFLPGYRSDLLNLLFGDILTITNTDLVLLTILLLITVVGLGLTLPQQILITLNPDLAKVQGINVKRDRYIFIVLLAVTIGLMIRAVGIILINSFLVIPAATSKLVTNQFVPFLGIAAAIGAFSALLGMVISSGFKLPAGPCMVVVQMVCFFVATLGFKRR